MIESHGAKLKLAAQKFQDGKLSKKKWKIAVSDWREDMAISVKTVHLNYSAAARPGIKAFADSFNQSRVLISQAQVFSRKVM